MAIKQDYILNISGGVLAPVPGAVIKVQDVSGSKYGVTALFSVFANGEIYPVKSFKVSFVPDADGDNWYKQSYLYVKTLPEFSDGVDI